MQSEYYVIELQHADGQLDIREIRDSSIIIGRSATSAQIQLANKKVSGKHAELAMRDNKVWLRDLGSTNGTFFLGEPIDGAVNLLPGEAFRIGDTALRLLTIHGADAPDEARTIVSLPAWMEEDSPASVEETRALNIDELNELQQEVAPSQSHGLDVSVAVSRSADSEVVAAERAILESSAAEPEVDTHHTSTNLERQAQPEARLGRQKTRSRHFFSVVVRCMKSGVRGLVGGSRWFLGSIYRFFYVLKSRISGRD